MLQMLSGKCVCVCAHVSFMHVIVDAVQLMCKQSELNQWGDMDGILAIATLGAPAHTHTEQGAHTTLVIQIIATQSPRF